MDSGQSKLSKSSRSLSAYSVILMTHCFIGRRITGYPPLSLNPPITSSFARTVPNSSHQLTSIVSIYANLLLSLNFIFSFSLKVSGIFNSDILTALFFSLSK